MLFYISLEDVPPAVVRFLYIGQIIFDGFNNKPFNQARTETDKFAMLNNPETI